MIFDLSHHLSVFTTYLTEHLKLLSLGHALGASCVQVVRPV